MASREGCGEFEDGHQLVAAIEVGRINPSPQLDIDRKAGGANDPGEGLRRGDRSARFVGSESRV